MSKEPSKYHPRDVEDDRSAAFGWAAAFRTRRAELRRELSSGERTLAEVLDGSDATADGAVKLLFVLESLPAAGKVTTRRHLASLGIMETVRLRDLGAEERDLVLREFPVAGGAAPESAP